MATPGVHCRIDHVHDQFRPVDYFLGQDKKAKHQVGLRPELPYDLATAINSRAYSLLVSLVKVTRGH